MVSAAFGYISATGLVCAAYQSSKHAFEARKLADDTDLAAQASLPKEGEDGCYACTTWHSDYELKRVTVVEQRTWMRRVVQLCIPQAVLGKGKEPTELHHPDLATWEGHQICFQTFTYREIQQDLSAHNLHMDPRAKRFNAKGEIFPPHTQLTLIGCIQRRNGSLVVTPPKRNKSFIITTLTSARFAEYKRLLARLHVIKAAAFSGAALMIGREMRMERKS
ncbi:MAG: hypothetical protein S4CHLAM102_03960 [Chlamydiia bacterium]|nr:hypothetical protein [Chlamydiia bacterium]